MRLASVKMHRLGLVVVPLLVCSSFAFGQEATVVRNANLRSSPSTSNPPMRLLIAPARVSLLESSATNGYYRIKTKDGDEGWVWARNVRVNSGVKSAPSSAYRTPTAGAKAGPSAIYPDSAMTPGATNPDITQGDIADTICNKSWSTASIRPPTSVTRRVKAKTMKAYGFQDSPSHYELDHLISLQVGGCPDCAENLWPEAYGDAEHPMTESQRAEWNRNNRGSSEVLPGSLEKDMVENHIHDEVCYSIADAKMSSLNRKFPPSVTITLERGQQILARDWYACFLKMTNGNEPCK